MQCYKKIAIENKTTGDYMMVACGKCNFCLQNRRNDWAIRMHWENKISMGSAFITLTYDNEHVPRVKGNMFDFTLKKRHLYRFLKTIKQGQARELKKTYWKAYAKEWVMRYFAVGEYGTKFKRPHYHVILFNVHPDTISDLRAGKYWKKGRIHAGTVTIESASYCAKYVIDKEPITDDNKQKPFATMSRGSKNKMGGLGHNYIEKNKQWHRADGEYYPDNFRIYMMHDGQKRRMPRYYKDRIFKARPGEREEILKEALQIHYADIQVIIQQEYEAEIERLGKLHKYPQLYYEERRKEHHDRIRTKSLQLNQL